MSEPSARDLRDVRDANVHTAFLLPSRIADAEAVIAGVNAPSASLALACARFLIEVRGLPLDETEIDSFGVVYKVRKDKRGSCAVILRGCTVPSCFRIEVDKIPLDVLLTLVDGDAVCVIRCDDCSFFSSEALGRIVYECSHAMPCGAVAISYRGDGLVAKPYFINDALDNPLTAARAAARAAGLGSFTDELRVTVGDTQFYLSSCDGGVAVSSDDEPPYVLFAP